MKTYRSSFLSFITLAISFCFAFVVVVAADGDAVVVKITSAGTGPPVTQDTKYESMVTLYIENDDGTKTPSGWSTRKADGAPVDQPFVFQPGVGLIQGWTEGVLQMKEGDRADLHVPSHKGYGARPMGSQGGGGFYIPANSNLWFDIEILGPVGGGRSQDL
mmetsp:Transcript_31912/g.48948  ORF Transcript_31912/g.48948 Transcript_31912/m.48948 type:complete len:161 (+) Transcript_31912:74-556(+)